jgi:hypothetical protein
MWCETVASRLRRTEAALVAVMKERDEAIAHLRVALGNPVCRYLECYVKNELHIWGCSRDGFIKEVTRLLPVCPVDCPLREDEEDESECGVARKWLEAHDISEK